jgi:GTP-binding protein
LRHIERTLVLVHLVDIYSEDIAAEYKTVQAELAAYKIDLTDRPQIVVLNKIDGLDDEIVQDKLSELRPLVPPETPLMAISAQSKAGVKELLYAIKDLVNTERQKVIELQEENGLPVLTLDNQELAWKVEKVENGYQVTGYKIITAPSASATLCKKWASCTN